MGFWDIFRNKGAGVSNLGKETVPPFDGNTIDVEAQPMTSEAGGLFSGIGEMFSNIINSITSLFSGIGDWFGQLFSRGSEAAGQQAGEANAEQGAKILEAGKGQAVDFSQTVDVAQEKAGQMVHVAETTKEQGQQVGEQAGNAAKGLLEKGQDYWDGLPKEGKVVIGVGTAVLGAIGLYKGGQALTGGKKQPPQQTSTYWQDRVAQQEAAMAQGMNR